MEKIAILATEYDRIIDGGWYEVEFERFKLDFYFKPSTTKAAYIHPPGWINRNEFPYPYFQRVKWLNELDGIAISLADPTQRLSADVQIGWFIGTFATDYAKVTAEFLEGLLRHFGIANDRTIFFGASAGGFSSMALATYIRGSKAFAVNPQTEVLRFHETHELAKAMRVGYRGMSNIRIMNSCHWRFSIAKLWQKENYVPATTILINTFDSWHIEHHLIPLIQGISGRSGAGALQVKFYSSEEGGHNPPPPHRWVPFMNELMASN